jgi:hypothetical protein
MIAISLLLALQLGQVDAGVDAPTAAITVQRGELVPFDGVLLSNGKAIEQAKRIVDAEARAEYFSEHQVTPAVQVVVAICVALTVGASAAAVGFAAGRASR